MIIPSHLKKQHINNMYSRFCQVHFIRPIIGGEPWWAPAKHLPDEQLKRAILKYGNRGMTAKQVYDRFQKQFNTAEKNLARAKEEQDEYLIPALNQSIAEATKIMRFTKSVDPTVDPAKSNSTRTNWWLPAKNLPNGKLKQAILEYGQQQNMTAKQVYDANQQIMEKIEEAIEHTNMNKDALMIQKLDEQYELADKIMYFIREFVDPTVDPNYRPRKVKSAHEIHAVQGHEIHLPFKEVPAYIVINDNRRKQIVLIKNIDPNSPVMDTLNQYAKTNEFLKGSRLVYHGSIIWNRDSKDADRTTWSDLNEYAYKITKRSLSDMQELQMI